MKTADNSLKAIDDSPKVTIACFCSVESTSINGTITRTSNAVLGILNELKKVSKADGTRWVRVVIYNYQTQGSEPSTAVASMLKLKIFGRNELDEVGARTFNGISSETCDSEDIRFVNGKKVQGMFTGNELLIMPELGFAAVY